MKLPQTGGCQCGKLRYEITEEPRSVYTCHCLDCQRLTGSAFSLGVVVPETGFRLAGVEPRQLSRTADSGRVSVRLVCPECGAQTRIGRKILGDGRKVRICRKCEGVVDK